MQLRRSNHHLPFETCIKKNEKAGLAGFWGYCQLRHSMMPWTNELLQRLFSNPEHRKVALVCSHNGNSCNLPTTGASSVPDSLISYIASLSIKPPSGHSLPCKATHQVTRGPHGQLWGVSCSTQAHAKPCAESQSSRVVYGHLYDHRTSVESQQPGKKKLSPHPTPLNSPGGSDTMPTGSRPHERKTHFCFTCISNTKPHSGNPS